jgi:hypothetical protein
MAGLIHCSGCKQAMERNVRICVCGCINRHSGSWFYRNQSWVMVLAFVVLFPLGVYLKVQYFPSTDIDPVAATKLTDTALADSTAVLNDAGALDKKYGGRASDRCSAEADAFLRSIAKFDFAWDETGFLESKFDQYATKVPSPGVLISISHKAKLQNGFGAFKHIVLYCNYDTQGKRVLDFFVQPS